MKYIPLTNDLGSTTDVLHLETSKKQELFKGVFACCEDKFFYISHDLISLLGYQQNEEVNATAALTQLVRHYVVRVLQTKEEITHILLRYQDALFELSMYASNDSTVFGIMTNLIEHVNSEQHTTQKKLHVALQKSESSLAIAQELAHIGYWDWNTTTDELYWSDGIFHIFDVAMDRIHVTTEQLGSFIHTEDYARVMAIIDETLQNQSSYHTEYRVTYKNKERNIRERAKVIQDDAGNIHMIGVIQDITETVTAEKEQKRLTSLIQATPDLIATVSTCGKLLYINTAGRTLLDISTETAESPLNVLQFLGYNELKKYKNMVSEVAMGKNPWSGECIFTTQQRRAIHVHMTLIGHRHDDGPIEYFSVIAQDISEQRRLENEIRYQAYHDVLTGLPNRTLLSDKLTQLTNEPSPLSSEAAILFIDLNDFKQINDSLGHTTGDTVLIEVAKRLRTCVKQNDLIARWGGDEFVVMVQLKAGTPEIIQIVQAIVHIIQEPILIRNEEFLISPSIGISLYPENGLDSETLIKHADIAMYHAKRQTGKSHEFYSPNMTTEERARQTIRNDLQKALTRNELEVYYQPFINLSTMNLIGAEALIRWNHPAHGLMTPAYFIPIAEETGLITAIDRFVIQKVCSELHEWNLTFGESLRIAVNISTKQFDDDEFILMLEDSIRLICPQSLELEITESAIMKNERSTLEKIKRLKELGLNLSLDDFGTGYSSLNYLRLFSTDTIKIDQAFVNEITSKPEVAAITQSLIMLAHDLSMKVVAEGVETEEQLEQLRRYGCDIVQGYLFSMPLPLEEFKVKFLKYL